MGAGKLLFFLFLCISSFSYAQSYFYFETKLVNAPGQALQYFIFLTVQTDGSAVARIRYVEPASGEDRLIEQHFTDSFRQETGDSLHAEKKYLIAGGDPYYVTGTDDSTFVRPVFVFQKQVDEQASFYIPESIEYQDRNKKWIKAEMTVGQQKSFSELSREKELVSKFFYRNDPFFTYLFTLDTRSLSKLERTVKLFLIIVANTNDKTIGITSKRDAERITETFTTLKNQLGISMILKQIAGNTFNKTMVDAAINTLKPAPSDIVIFYYSGHGFRYSNESSPYPRISLRKDATQDIDKNNLSIEDIYNRIVKKGARVNIVLSDCCNENIGTPVPIGKELLQTKTVGTAGTKLNFDHCKALFFPVHPIAVLSSAAEKNQLAVGNPALGGFFTSFFHAQLVNSLYTGQGESSWLRILLNAKESTRKQALTALCGNGRCIQRAEISVIPPL